MPQEPTWLGVAQAEHSGDPGCLILLLGQTSSWDRRKDRLRLEQSAAQAGQPALPTLGEASEKAAPGRNPKRFRLVTAFLETKLAESGRAAARGSGARGSLKLCVTQKSTQGLCIHQHAAGTSAWHRIG